MPRQPSGAYLLPASSVNPPVFGTAISGPDFAAQNNDIATEITNSVDRGGRGAMTANLSMGGFKVTGAAAAVAATDGTILSDVQGYLPAGAILEFAMSTAPAGWLECNGSAVARTGATAALFAAIGTTWGVGDGSTTFNLPDFRGYFRRGFDNGRGIDTGRVFASVQSDDFLSHTHTQNFHNHGITDPGHFHAIGISQVAGASAGGSNEMILSGSTNTTTKVTGITINTAQAGNTNTGGVETVPKNYAVLVCIRT